ncbi:hypothetical protein OH76DRAFT_151253 [Lentinus brumalis]|uniref:Uncharacterized protein n=1 Tax=Lentinus brumalis TaxID=2498619 RepID=A0A371CNW6_9APHY|nr:hypothetical protein OH76DRAFT_151253 [Polyporus brumalis]
MSRVFLPYLLTLRCYTDSKSGACCDTLVWRPIKNASTRCPSEFHGRRSLYQRQLVTVSAIGASQSGRNLHRLTLVGIPSCTTACARPMSSRE